jgi:hypothetical protein
MTWNSWKDALDWCRKHAHDDVWVLAKDWYEAGEYGYGTVARLKYEHGAGCFFYKGFHRYSSGKVAE